MEILLYTAAALMFLVAFAHSYLGERYILIRLFKREQLPKLFGSDDFTRKTLRFAWHVTSIAWLGFAFIAIALAHPELTHATIGLIISATFAVHFLIALIASKGKHLSWIVFLLIAVCIYLATRSL